MKVVITGGTGFIGLNLARAIIRRGRLTSPSGKQEEVDSILLFDQFVPDGLPDGLDERVTMRAGDISDRDTVFGLVDRDDISVFHLASVVSGAGEKDFDLAMRVNLDGGSMFSRRRGPAAACPASCSPVRWRYSAAAPCRKWWGTPPSRRRRPPTA